MLQGEHSAILSTFIKLPFSIKTFVLSIFEWLLKTGFTVPKSHVLAQIEFLYFNCLFIFFRGKEPDYRIVQEPPTGHPGFLVAEITLPQCVSYSTKLKL